MGGANAPGNRIQRAGRQRCGRRCRGRGHGIELLPLTLGKNRRAGGIAERPGCPGRRRRFEANQLFEVVREIASGPPCRRRLRRQAKVESDLSGESSPSDPLPPSGWFKSGMVIMRVWSIDSSPAGKAKTIGLIPFVLESCFTVHNIVSASPNPLEAGEFFCRDRCNIVPSPGASCFSRPSGPISGMPSICVPCWVWN